MSKVRTILHATDFSMSARAALKLAGSLARDHGAKLVLLHVAQQPTLSVSGMPAPPQDAIVGWESLKSHLSAMASEIRQIQAEARVVEGEPAKTIVEVAAELAAELIVIGSHGRTGLRRLLMGSVAEYVVRHASCPVVTVSVPAQKAN